MRRTSRALICGVSPLICIATACGGSSSTHVGAQAQTAVGGTSAAAATSGACSGEGVSAGVSLGGANGDGLCVGVRQRNDRSEVAVLYSGHAEGAMVLDRCSVSRAAAARVMIASQPDADHPGLLFGYTTPATSEIRFQVDDKSVTADAFAVPNVSDIKFYALTVKDPDSVSGVEELDASQQPVVRREQTERCTP